MLSPHHAVRPHHVAPHLLEPAHVVSDSSRGELAVCAHVVWREVLHAHVAVVRGRAVVLVVPCGGWRLAGCHVVGGRLHAIGR